MHLLKQKFILKKSLKNKLLLITVFLTLFPTIFFLVVFSLQISAEIRDSNIEKNKNDLKNFTNHLNRTFQTMQINSEYIINDSSIRKGLMRNYDSGLIEKSEFYVSTRSIINNTALGNLRFSIYTDNDHLFEYSYFSKMDRLVSIISNEDFNEIMKTGTKWLSNFSQNQNTTSYLTLYRKFQMAGDYEAILRTDVSVDMIKIAYYESFFIDNSIISYLDGRGNEILISDSTINTSSITDTFEELLDNGHTVKMGVINIHNASGFFRDYGYILIILILFIGSFVSISFFTIIKITKSLEEFISVLNSNGLKGIQINDYEEIAIIKRKFLNLLDNNEKLYNENLEFIKRSNLLELDIMQNKLNPHLLYNSLSVIRWKAISNSDNETLELIDHMTTYYRAILSRGNNIIPLSEELNLLSDYVNICRLAHRQEYQMVVNYDEDIKNVYIPKTLLQPFIENSIRHGLNGKDGKKLIKISVITNIDKTIISIFDNGKGIPADKLIKLNENALEYTELSGFGINNVVERISNTYGENSSIRFYSEINKFTEVRLSLPILQKEDIPGSL